MSFSRLCPDCDEKLDKRYFRALLQHKAVSGSGRSTDPAMYALIHEYNYQPGVSSTGQSRDCDLCILVITRFTRSADTLSSEERSWKEGWDIKWKQQWARKWVTGRWLAEIRSSAGEFLDVAILRIQLRDDEFGSMDEDFLIGEENLLLDVRTVTGNPAAKYITNREFDNDFTSPSNRDLGRSWMNQCIQGHKACAPQISSAVPPTRVLDIGNSSSDNLCLYITNGQATKYAALSYCWGQKHVRRTTRANFDASFDSIASDTLSQTIKDAIKVARGLQIRYLWIDALCIIQDSVEDKMKELANMANIYENATVTLVASCAPGADEGFLHERPSPRVDVRIPYGNQGTLLLRESLAMKSFDEAPDPTETRAWCFQESLLSRRCLVFSSLRLYWSCQEVTYADLDVQLTTNPNYLPDNINHFVQNLPSVFHSKRSGEQLRDIDWRQIWDFWRNIVSEYSRRDISFLSDRFPAMSALATRVHETTKDGFYAGLWRRDFARQLLWKKSTVEDMDTTDMTKVSLPKHRPDHFLAPTWSWASCIGKVVYPSSTVRPEFRVDDVEVKLANSSEPFGAVRSGSVTVTGRLEQIKVLKPRPAAGLHFLARKEKPLSEIRSKFASGVGEAKGFPDAMGELVESMEDLWCLEIGMRPSGSSVPSGRHMGLILHQLGQQDVFRRIGYFLESTADDHWFQSSEPRTILIL